MNLVLILCCWLGVSDSLLLDKFKGVHFVLPRTPTLSNPENEKEDLGSSQKAIDLAWKILHEYDNSELPSTFALVNLNLCSVYEILSEFQDNQIIVNYLESLALSWKVIYPGSKVLKSQLAEIYEMQLQFWQIEACLLLDWAREGLPDSLIAVGRVESIFRRTGLRIEELGSNEKEFNLLQEFAVQQMRELVGREAKRRHR